MSLSIRKNNKSPEDKEEIEKEVKIKQKIKRK